ncbi:hypothetical protein HYH02_008128 [Chlamydomonas schloesseri]|uniref:Protein kinase domain-containing protein n=1 Tax=Chlamydomonas schloesseri TaxID=2026947 RepID=A0A835WGT4_9CHLO|nr:hypothetical protein HYH02_008128 [Chlamydomonas schloesseri]|eukprot:KAG2446974.1 hypothetical protein HYH02_008128 [Chlamydomonas schloesseri]
MLAFAPPLSRPWLVAIWIYALLNVVTSQGASLAELLSRDENLAAASSPALLLQRGLTSVEDATLEIPSAKQLAVVGLGPSDSGLDLRAFGVSGAAAFRLLDGSSSLELHNLTLLLPPMPEAATASGSGALPPSVLAHVIEAVAGNSGSSSSSRAQVLLRGVTLVVGSCSDLDNHRRWFCRDLARWRARVAAYDEPTILNGTVRYGSSNSSSRAPGGGGLMALGSSAAAAAAAGGDSPPLAQLLDCTVTCDAGAVGASTDGGGASTSTSTSASTSTASGVVSTPFLRTGPSGPWDCVAVTVSDSAGLAALPDLWEAAANIPSGYYGASLLVTVEAGRAVQVDTSHWRSLWVAAGNTVAFIGRGRAASTLHLSGLGRGQLAAVGSDLDSQGLVAVCDLALVGLGYPNPADDERGLMAGWVHAIDIPGKRYYNTILGGIFAGRLAPLQVMVRLDNVRLALPDTEAEWWRNAAPVAAGGEGLLNGLAPVEWEGPQQVATSSAAADASVAPPGGSSSSSSSSSGSIAVGTGSIVNATASGTWEVGPMRLSYAVNWAWDSVWVAPLSSQQLLPPLLLAEGEGSSGDGAAASSSKASSVAETSSASSLREAGADPWKAWPMVQSVGAELARQLPLRHQVRMLLSIDVSSYVVLASMCSAARAPQQPPPPPQQQQQQAAGVAQASASPASVTIMPAAGDVLVMPPTDPAYVLQKGGGSPDFTTRLRQGAALGANMLPLGGHTYDQVNFQSDAPVVWLGGEPRPGARCVLLPPPAAQSATGPATWDMMDLSGRVRIRVGPAAAGSDSDAAADGPSLQIQGFALYNLAPYAQPQPPDPPQPPSPPQPPLPPELPPSPPDLPPSPPQQPAASPVAQDSPSSDGSDGPPLVVIVGRRLHPSDPFHGLSLGLPFFQFDRFSPLLFAPGGAGQHEQASTQQPRRLPPPLALVNCTLVVPAPELELLRRLLAEAGRLPPGSSSGSTSDGGAAEVAEASATAISFTRISFLGWSGRDVVVTSQLPNDAPTTLIRSPAELKRPLYSTLLEVSCSPPPPQPPSAAPPPGAPRGGGGGGVAAAAAADGAAAGALLQETAPLPTVTLLADGDSAAAAAKAAAKAAPPLWRSLDATQLLKPAASVVARSRALQQLGASGGHVPEPAAAGGSNGSGSATSRMIVLSRSCRVADAVEVVVQTAEAARGGHQQQQQQQQQQQVGDSSSRDDGGISRAIARVQRTSNSSGEAGGRDEELWLECVIGRGGFGVVYLGTWRSLPVAVKTLVVHEALLGEEGRRRQRAVLEAAVSSTLCHANVVQTYAFDVRRLGVGRGTAPPALEAVPEEGEEEGQPREQLLQPAAPVPGSEADSVYQLLLIQAYCEGGSLRDGIISGGLYMGLAPDSPIGVLLGLCLALDVAAGMAHVHARGIVHGDLSSGNVLLTARPAGGAHGGVYGVYGGAAAAGGNVEGTTAGTSASLHPHGADMEAARGRVVAAVSVEEAQAAAVEAAARALVADVMQPPVMAKIADFGLSARMGEGQTHASNCWQGTPAYTAPEVEVEGRLGKPADVYSFGVLLLELLSGRAAHDGLLSMAALMAPAGDAGAGVGGAVLMQPGMAAAPAAAVLSAAAPSLVPAICSGSNTQLVGMLSSCLSPTPRDRPTFTQILQVISAAIAELDMGNHENIL